MSLLLLWRTSVKQSKAGKSQPRARRQNYELVNTGPLSPKSIFNGNQRENYQRITCKKSPHNWKKTQCERCSTNCFSWENDRKIVYFTFGRLGTFCDRSRRFPGPSEHSGYFATSCAPSRRPWNGGNQILDNKKPQLILPRKKEMVGGKVHAKSEGRKSF